MRERTCCRNGKRRSRLEWLRVLFKRGPYFYQVGPVRSGVFHIYRRPATYDGQPSREQFEWLCANGHWAPHASGQPDMLFYQLHSSRAADEYVRRLNNGIPNNYGAWIAVGGILIAVVEVIVAWQVVA